ncbi:MAG: iron-containing alcohol dehydrogenase [Pseudomonadota bacterium]
MMNFNYYMPTKVMFGVGKLEELGKVALPGKRPLVVTSNGGSMRRNGYIDRVMDLLKANGCDPVLYDQVAPNPTLVQVMDGVALANESGCDFVVGLGGGSPIDASKAIATTVTNGGNYWDYICGGTGGGKTPEKPALPIVAIPTTAGTGTEADPWTVVTNEDTNEKIGWGNDHTFPVFSIVDPSLMVSVPPAVTAMTGMDAFFHASEAYLALCRQPASDLLALEAVNLLTTFLPLAVAQGNNIQARTMVAWASTAAGLCESYSSCIAQHSLEHALSAFHPNMPHGAGLVMISLAFFEVMARVQPKRCADMAMTMGENLEGMSLAEQGMAMVTALRKLIKNVGLDTLSLADYGVTEEEIPALARNAREAMGGLFTVTPVDLSQAMVEEIFMKSLKG